MKWNWQQSDWPHFRYDKTQFEKHEGHFLHSAGLLLGVIQHLNEEAKEKLRIELITNEALQTSAIEGEILDRDSVQSSLRRQFGLPTDPHGVPPAEQGIAEMMVDLYQTFDQPLTHERLHRWHRMLMKGRAGMKDIGRYRTHEDAMQVVSGRLDRPKIHFEAPPAPDVPKEMDLFVEWFNRTASGGAAALTPMARAGIAHLYFVAIHPFEDGNGRIGRAVSEKVLAQSLGRPTLLALADAIKRRQKEYYRALAETNKNNDITSWLVWFAETVVDAQRSTQVRAEFLIQKAKMLDRLRDQLNPRQEKVLLRMFREGPEGFKGGMSAEKYIQIAPASPATVTRDLQDLVEKGALRRTGERKHTRYFLTITPRLLPG